MSLLALVILAAVAFYALYSWASARHPGATSVRKAGIAAAALVFALAVLAGGLFVLIVVNGEAPFYRPPTVAR